MHDEHPRRDLSVVGDFPSDPVCLIELVSQIKLSVELSVLSAGPCPAAQWVNLLVDEGIEFAFLGFG